MSYEKLLELASNKYEELVKTNTSVWMHCETDKVTIAVDDEVVFEITTIRDNVDV